MKTVKTILGVLVLIVMLTTVSCKDAKRDETTIKKEYASAYVCPMHCEGSGSDKEGECPKCGMEFKGVMLYSCMQPDCPVQLKPSL